MFVTEGSHPSSPAGDVPAQASPGLETLSDQELEDTVCTNAAHLTVAECRQVLLVAELDRRGTWAGQGLRSCAHWLNWRLGVSLSTAREQVRVGRALESLPVVTAAFSKGELSYSKVRALTRVATPVLEASLVDMARYATAAQLEQIVSAYRRADPAEGTDALARHRTRYLRTHRDEDGMVVISARLSPEDGAVVVAAIEAARRALADDRDRQDADDASVEGASVEGASVEGASVEGASVEGGRIGAVEVAPEPFDPAPGPAPGPADGAEDPCAASAADALVTLCDAALSQGVRPVAERPAPTVVLLHLDEAVAQDAGAGGCAYLEGIGAVSAHTAQRLACQGTVAALRFAPEGTVAQEGATRQVPPSLRRAVLARDGGCRWPGCTQRRFVDVHHVKFASHDGPTRLDNLVTTCRHHHRMVHEGGYRLAMDPSARVTVWDPVGAEIAANPALPSPTGPGLAASHEEQGLSLGPETLAYCGEPFDLGMAIDCLWQAAHPRPGRLST